MGLNPGLSGKMPPKRSTALCLHWSWRLCGLKECIGGAFQGRENLAATEFHESELVKKGPRTVNRLTVFAKPDGTSLGNDLCLSPEFDPESELANGRVKALTKTDCLVWRDSRTSKQTSCFYNYLSERFVGNYRIGSSHNPSKIGLWGLIKRLTTILKV